MATIFPILDNNDKDGRYSQPKQQIHAKKLYVEKLHLKKENYLILRFARVFGEWCMQHWVKRIRNKKS